MELIVIACLLSAPETCKEHRLRLTLEGGDAGQCMYSSPPRVARWQVMNRNWKVERWYCAMVSDDEII
ncbi:MAG: hypothetical protein AAFU72_08210 [Pseudomonadota bacterium]